MAGHDNQKQVGELLSQSLKNFRKNCLLAFVRAAAEKYPRAGWHADLAQDSRDVERALRFQVGSVKLEAADDANRFRAATEFAQTGGIGLILSTHTGERRK